MCNLSSWVHLPNYLFWLFLSAERFMLVECLKRCTLIAQFQNFSMIVHVPATCCHSLSLTLNHPQQTPECGKRSMSWYSVNPTRCAGQSSTPPPSVGWDSLCSYHPHQDLYSVARSMALCFAPAGQFMQMAGTAHSIPGMFMLILHGLLL